MRDNITILNESWTSELLFSSSFQKYTKLRYWINKFSCSLIKFCYIPNFPGTKCLSHFPVPPPSFAFSCVWREKKIKYLSTKLCPVCIMLESEGHGTEFHWTIFFRWKRVVYVRQPLCANVLCVWTMRMVCWWNELMQTHCFH